MKHLDIKIVSIIILIMVALMQACSTSVGGNEDKTSPSVVIDAIVDADDTDGEIIGNATIQWTTTEPNRSTVDIYLSSDSGMNFDTAIVLNAADTGEHAWDTNTVDDCRNCRLRIIATDIVGNVSLPSDMAEDFIINNVPQVLGDAYYTDTNGDGTRDGDVIRVPFDKPLVLKTSIASDIFELPVEGDNIGSFAEVAINPSNHNELIVTMNGLGAADFQLHIPGRFHTDRLYLTAPSGLNLRSDISANALVAKDTGRTATRAPLGIDIAPGFADSGQALGSSVTKSVVLGDVDGDGDLDMVAGNDAGQANLVWLNGGDNNGNKGVLKPGVFADSGQALGSSNTWAVALGDVDGDGDLDMVTGNNGQANRVWLNGGDASGSNTGVFVDSGQALGSSNTRAVALADVDGDSDLDLVAMNYGQADRVWLNGGDASGSNTGVFVDSGQSLGAGEWAVALGDVDGDGDLDLVSDGGVSLNGGDASGSNTGVFATPSQSLNSAIQSIALGDVDGDGDLDLVTGNVFNLANRVWLNGGDNSGSNTGVFVDSGQALGNRYTRSVVMADVDGDGDLDLLVGNENGNRVWLNGGDTSGSNTGVFTDSGQALGSYTFSIAVGDLDGDGDLDLVEGRESTFTAGLDNSVWLNSMRYTKMIFDSSQQALGENSTWAISLGDVDGDGDLDMVEGNANSQANRVWLNGGDSSGRNTGVFVDSGQALGGSSTFAITMGDVDGDGDLDLVSGNIVQPNRVWLNGGNASGSNTGVFTDSGQSLGSSDTYAVVLGDVDGDDDLDLVTGNSGANRVWLNGGDASGSNTGVFTDSGQALGNSTTLSIALGDVDGDGDLDIVAGNSGAANRVWLNGGDASGSNTGVFADSGQSLGNNLTRSIMLGDVDGDGDLDMVEGNWAGEANKVWLNGGDASGSNTGVFVDSGQPALGSSYTRSVALGDIDDDGDLDIVEGSDAGQANRVWLNGGDASGSNTGVFTDIGQALGNEDTTAVVLGDIDGDGDLDMVAGNSDGANLMWLNDY